jgi:hypothetical protein
MKSVGYDPEFANPLISFKNKMLAFFNVMGYNHIMTNDEKLIAEFFARGGIVKRCRPGTPKDLYGLKFRGLFGGRRNYESGLLYRSKSAVGELFEKGSIVARPSTVKRA